MSAVGALHPQWNGGYIFLSYVIACLGSMASLELMKMRTGVTGLRNILLLIGGALSVGTIGIWSMHFIGMMALTLVDDFGNHIRMGYSGGLTAVSAICSIVILCAGFAIAGDPNHPRIWKNLLSGLAGGLGVSVMHYTGMLAMTGVKTEWNAGIIVASVFIGIVAATAAMFIFFRFGKYWNADLKMQWATSCIMGIAVCGMHYTGMQAATFYPPDSPVDMSAYASHEELLGTILTLTFGSLVILVALRVYFKRLLQAELDKSQCLALAVILEDENGNIYVNATGAPPTAIIERSYVGVERFEQTTANFIRFFRTSFRWATLREYEATLRESSASGNSKIDAQSVALFSKFVVAIESLSKELNIPVAQFGRLYWNTENCLMTVVFPVVKSIASPEQLTRNRSIETDIVASTVNSPSARSTLKSSGSSVLMMPYEKPNFNEKHDGNLSQLLASSTNTSFRFQSVESLTSQLHLYLRMEENVTCEEYLAERRAYYNKQSMPVHATDDGSTAELLHLLVQAGTEAGFQDAALAATEWLHTLDGDVEQVNASETIAEVSDVPPARTNCIRSVASLAQLTTQVAPWRQVNLPEKLKFQLQLRLKTTAETPSPPLPSGDSASKVCVALYFTTATSSRGLQVMVPSTGPYGMIPHEMISDCRSEEIRPLLRELTQMRRHQQKDGTQSLEFCSDASEIQRRLNEFDPNEFIDPVEGQSSMLSGGGNNSRGERSYIPSARDPNSLGLDASLHALANPRHKKSVTTMNNKPFAPSSLHARTEFLAACDRLGKQVGTSSDLKLSTLSPFLVDVTPRLRAVVFVVCKMSPVVPEAYRASNVFTPLAQFEVMLHAAVTKTLGSSMTAHLSNVTKSNCNWVQSLLSDQLSIVANPSAAVIVQQQQQRSLYASPASKYHALNTVPTSLSLPPPAGPIGPPVHPRLREIREQLRASQVSPLPGTVSSGSGGEEEEDAADLV